MSREIFGPAHPAYAIDLMGLANVLMETGELERAEMRYREALAIQREALPSGHPRTATTLTGHPAEGQDLLVRGAEGLDRLRGGEDAYASRARERLETHRAGGG